MQNLVLLQKSVHLRWGVVKEGGGEGKHVKLGKK